MTGLVILAGIIAFVAWLFVKAAENQPEARERTLQKAAPHESERIRVTPG